MGKLLKLPVVGVGKEGKRGEKGWAIERGDKSPKELLILLTKIRERESMACLSRTMRDNSAKTTKRIPLLKSFIRSALISPIVVKIKSVFGPLLSY